LEGALRRELKGLQKELPSPFEGEKALKGRRELSPVLLRSFPKSPLLPWWEKGRG